MDDLEGLEALDVIGECLDRILAALDACPEVDDPEAKAAAVKIRAAAIEAGEALMARRDQVDAALIVLTRSVLPVLGFEIAPPAERPVDA